MKIKLLLLALFVFGIHQAQNVTIPDATFKNWLLNHNPVIDTNNDNEIQVSEAEAYTGVLNYTQSQAVIDFYNCEPNCQMQYAMGTPDYDNCLMMCNLDYNGIIRSLEGLEAFKNVSEITFWNIALFNQSNLQITNFSNLTTFRLSSLNIQGGGNSTNIDLSNNLSLKEIILSEDNVLWDLSSGFVYTNVSKTPTLLTSNSTAIETISCVSMGVSSLDLSTNVNLKTLDCSKNEFSNLDVTGAIGLEALTFEWNSNQTTLVIDSNNTLLNDLKCKRSKIMNLDLSNIPNLLTVDCSFNDMTSLNLSNLVSLTSLDCSYNMLTALDISTNNNLISLNCYKNDLATLTFDNNSNSNIETVNCDYNSLTELDISNNINLKSFSANSPSANLQSLNTDNCTSLEQLICPGGIFTTLDLSSNISLTKVSVNSNPNLNYINLKNGNNSDFSTNNMDNVFNYLPSLTRVCVDELNTALVAEIGNDVNHPVNFSKYCTLSPKRKNEINGNVKIDLDVNGCDISDVSGNNLLVVADNGTDSFGTFTQANGDFVMYTNLGNFNTSIASTLPSYYATNPISVNSSFVSYNNVETINFCITPNQPTNDVNIVLAPLTQAVPGFISSYKLIFKNTGSALISGDVVLNFDDSKLNFLNASETIDSQTSNSLTFNYANLNTYETREIDISFNVLPPPTTNINDFLSFTASVNPIPGDITPDDNIFEFNQIVIGSYDPNDITVLEGEEILIADAGKYLHYVIRFQNTGTAEAINVVVANELDAKLDWSTLQLESMSHSSRVAIENGNKVEFIFENIHLPDSTVDEPGSHGFIAYKIKPKSNVVIGDIFSSTADIFFDFNEAIVTNTATTEIIAPLGMENYKLSNYSVYPNPTSGVLLINSKTTITKIEVYNYLGQVVMENTNKDIIDISKLDTGLYFVKIKDVNGDSGMEKVIKK